MLMSCLSFADEDSCLSHSCVWATSAGWCHDPSSIMGTDAGDGALHPSFGVILLVVAVLLVVWKLSGRFFPSHPTNSDAKPAVEVIEWTNVFTMFLNGQKITLVNLTPRSCWRTSSAIPWSSRAPSWAARRADVAVALSRSPLSRQPLAPPRSCPSTPACARCC